MRESLPAGRQTFGWQAEGRGNRANRTAPVADLRFREVRRYHRRPSRRDRDRAKPEATFVSDELAQLCPFRRERRSARRDRLVAGEVTQGGLEVRDMVF